MPNEANRGPEIDTVLSSLSGGPDDFGYTWSNVALNWVNVSSGTNVYFGGSNHSSAVNIGFPFKYYENAYSQLYVSRYGFLAFNTSGINNSQSEIPLPALPNDVIAPHWVPAWDYNYVRYMSGGSAPNRWFAVEWNGLESDCCDDGIEVYTFQAVLYEGGDILFQYGNMFASGSYLCQASGIEDSSGLDGLSITDFCDFINGNHAVRIYRPAPGARVKATPPFQGRFTRAGAKESFQVEIVNTGDTGPDTFDIIVNSSWPYALYQGTSSTPLGDSNSNSLPDTGSLAEGAHFTARIEVDVPGGATVGAADSIELTAQSSLNVSKSKVATVQLGVPAPFAQVFRDSSDGLSVNMLLAQPAGQGVARSVPNKWAYSPAVAETETGFVTVWGAYGWNGQASYYDIEYSLLDRFGQPTRPVTRLTNNSTTSVNNYANTPAVAVAPNGRIGVVWYRYFYNSQDNTNNYNIYFAILDQNGDLAYGPTNLTNNAKWGQWSDYGVPRFYNPRIAATGDNRFVIAWEREIQEAPGGGCSQWCYREDVYTLVKNTNGQTLSGPTKLAAGDPSSAWYSAPSITSLTGNRALVAYRAIDGLTFVVLNSSGGIVNSAARIPGSSPYVSDVAQFSDGCILFAWNEWVAGFYRIRFAILEDSTFNIVAGPTTLANPAGLTGDNDVSVVADANNQVVLTWGDDEWSYRSNIFYALVDDLGVVLTQPMVFYTSDNPGDLVLHSNGFANTSYSWTPPEDVDAYVDIRSSRVMGSPGGEATAPVAFGNHGASLATSVVMTATLDSELSYLGDTSGVLPTVDDDQLTWEFSDLALLQEEQFELNLGLPGGAIVGDSYEIHLELASDGPEVNGADNHVDDVIIAGNWVFLSVIRR